LTAPKDLGGAITEAQATGISDDGLALCGTGVNPRSKVEARVARNVMKIDCGDGCDNDGDGFADCGDTDCAIQCL